MRATHATSSAGGVTRRSGWQDAGGELLALVLLRDLLPQFEHPVASGLPALLEALDLRLLREDERLAVIFGCAGLIGPLLKIGTPLAVALALEAGDRLVDRQDDGEDGYSRRSAQRRLRVSPMARPGWRPRWRDSPR